LRARVSTEPAAEGSPPEQSGVWATVRDLVPNILTALVGAVGVVGFVSVVGGAITWNRFNSVELPADQAVAALPKSELVTIGVSALVVFLLLGAGAVVLVGQIERRGPGQRRWVLLTLVAIGMTYAIWLVPTRALADRIGVPTLQKVMLTALIALAWALAFVLLGWRSNEPGGAPALKRWLCGDEPTDGRWKRPWLRKLCQLNPTHEKGGWARTVLTVHPAHATARLMMLLFAAEILFAAVLWLAYDAWLGSTLLIGGVLGAICLLIGDRDRKSFGDYGLAIFVAVVIFGGATEAMKARYRPQVQPAALIRVGEQQGEGLCGLYVTENSDRVYFGRIRPDRKDPALPARNSGRIFFVDRKKVAALSIGPLMSIEDAVKRASQLRAELVVDTEPPAQPHETIVSTRRFKKAGVTHEVQSTRTVTVPARTAGSTKPSASPGNPAAVVPPSQDPELAARRAEAELSCAPPPAAPPTP
jgi:hypothetical protein